MSWWIPGLSWLVLAYPGEFLACPGGFLVDFWLILAYPGGFLACPGLSWWIPGLSWWIPGTLSPGGFLGILQEVSIYKDSIRNLPGIHQDWQQPGRAHFSGLGWCIIPGGFLEDSSRNGRSPEDSSRIPPGIRGGV